MNDKDLKFIRDSLRPIPAMGDDPVSQFIYRVNARAIADPIWLENYVLALYRAFVAESQSHGVRLTEEGKRVTGKHGN